MVPGGDGSRARDVPQTRVQRMWGTKSLAQTTAADLTHPYNKLISDRCSILFLFVIRKNHDSPDTVNVVSKIPNRCALSIKFQLRFTPETQMLPEKKDFLPKNFPFSFGRALFVYLLSNILSSTLPTSQGFQRKVSKPRVRPTQLKVGSCASATS